MKPNKVEEEVDLIISPSDIFPYDWKEEEKLWKKNERKKNEK